MALTPRTQLPSQSEQTNNFQLDRIQQTIRDTQQQVNARGGQPQTTDTVNFSGAVTVIIEHKLGRIPVEWTVVDVDAFASFKRVAWTDKTVSIASNAACNARFKLQ